MPSVAGPTVPTQVGGGREWSLNALPKVTSPDKMKLKTEPRRAVVSPNTLNGSMSPARNSHHPHPLSQPPITATTPTSTHPTPSPLPVVALALPQVASLRGSLHRRRSSFPPAVGSSVTGANAYPWVMGGTPNPRPSTVGIRESPGFGNEIEGGIGRGMTAMNGAGAWESLLNFDLDDERAIMKADADSHSNAQGVSSHCSNSISSATQSPKVSSQPAPRISTPSKAAYLERSNSATGLDNAWGALLARTIDVEGVGTVGVARLLSEVWKRGGPGVVTNQCLWPNIVMSLSLSSDAGASVRVGTPTAEVALKLQALYNVALRPSEPIIFAGFLASHLASTAPTAVNAFQEPQTYGPLTPTKSFDDLELSQWTTFTPGEEWPSLATSLPSGPGLTPRRAYSPAMGLPPIDMSDMSRPGSSAPGEGITGLNELLAQMEETDGQEYEPSSNQQGGWGAKPPQNGNPYDGSVTVPPKHHPPSSAVSTASPVDNMVGSSQSSSPFVSAASLFSATSASTTIPSAPMAPDALQPMTPVQQHPSEMSSKYRQAPPTQLILPQVPFIPPPPMCMFFRPTFRDLQQGKVGVWKGELVVRGRGGGNFKVLIIGEEGSDQLWQSHTWPTTMTYPPEKVTTESFTATMIPVSTLAREGLLPVSMGMVLSDDEDISPFVNMVQGLHAEGVAFHLPIPGSPLPIVFLPAKFDATDPLQRLGIAYMTRGGIPPPMEPFRAAAKEEKSDEDEDEGPQRKRRRKSTTSAVGKSGSGTKDSAASKGPARRRSTGHA